MPIEGTENITDTSSQNTSDGTEKTTAAATETKSGTVTDTAQQTQAQTTEKTFTQPEVDRMFQTRLKAAIKAELKKLSGENGDAPTGEEMQRQLGDMTTRVRGYEAREQVRDYLADAGNKLNVRPENMRAIEKLVMAEIKFADDGSPSNVKEAVESVKSLAPALFANQPSSIDAGLGRNGGKVTGNHMNDFIRQAAGIG